MDDVEKQRVRLEENVAKLRKALQHWQLWEVEYSELKDAVEALPPNATPDDLQRVGEQAHSSLLTKKESDELLGLNPLKTRDRDQVAGVISRRIDYVQKNAESVQRQLDLAEKELDSTGEEEEDSVPATGGLPIMDIFEELDEDGNVVSSSVSNATDNVPTVVDVLKKAGVADLDTVASQSNTADGPPPNETESHARSSVSPPRGANGQSSVTMLAPQTALEPDGISQGLSEKRKKSVSFAPELSISEPPARRRSSPPPQALPPTPVKSKAKAPWEVEESRKGRFHSGSRVVELDEHDKEIGSLPVVPREDESPEDAALRREMNEYALSEVGAIVAEMDLEEGDSDFDEDDEELDEDASLEGSDDGENEYGISMGDRISEEDRQAMLDLERRLSARMMENIGPRSEGYGLKDYAGDIRKLVARPSETENIPKKTSPTPPRKKGVHFADDFDIPSPSKRVAQSGKVSAARSAASVADSVLERKSATPSADASSGRGKKTSLFKQSRIDTHNASSSTPKAKHAHMGPLGQPSVPIHLRQEPGPATQKVEPTGPSGQTVSSTVVERPANTNAFAPPGEVGTDPALLQQELALENRRHLNRMVEKQGGFKASDVDTDNLLVEERDGKVRKVSLFKAARLNTENS